jgi:hypothetical protein
MESRLKIRKCACGSSHDPTPTFQFHQGERRADVAKIEFTVSGIAGPDPLIRPYQDNPEKK